MSDAPEPELDIYCEDNAAELLIKQALPLDVANVFAYYRWAIKVRSPLKVRSTCGPALKI